MAGRRPSKRGKPARRRPGREHMDIDWGQVVGETTDDSWQEDWRRKFATIDVAAKELLRLADRLAEFDALRKCSPEVLRTVPAAASYYVALAGFSQKTLKNSTDYARTKGLERSPESYVKGIEAGSTRVTARDREVFSKWVNGEIEQLMLIPPRDARYYPMVAAMIMGERSSAKARTRVGTSPSWF